LGMKVAGFVLTGGQSSRMGQDKARLLLGSRYLIEQVAETVSQVTDSVMLVGRPEMFTDVKIRCLRDMRPGLGPLAGIEAALLSSRADFGDTLNLVVGCDMPGLRSNWLVQLLSAALETGALCVAAKDSAGKTHPLCAVYRSACLPVIQGALDSGRLRLMDLLANVGAVELPIGDVIANVNTPSEWAAWQERTIG
jgi:molybdopterin-guanine dinucleotide biosynthesis protein A